MSYRWHKVGNEWESFDWQNFCIAAAVAHGVFFLGWILVSYLVTGRWNHRIFEGATCAVVGFILMISWHRFRSTESPDFASEGTAALQGKTDSPLDAVDLSAVLRAASAAGTSVFTIIEFLHVYDIDPATGRGRHACPPWYTLWLYAGRIADLDDDDECGSGSEDWVRRHAMRLDGQWYASRNAHAAANRVVAALTQAGYETEAEFLVGD